MPPYVMVSHAIALHLITLLRLHVAYIMQSMCDCKCFIVIRLQLVMSTDKTKTVKTKNQRLDYKFIVLCKCTQSYNILFCRCINL